MNDMTQALQAAGVKLPSVRQRVYNIIRDNPGWTQTQIIKSSGLSFQTVSLSCREMTKAGLIIMKPHPDNGPVGATYQCDLVRFPKYEWERSNASKPKAAKAVAKTQQAPTPAPTADTSMHDVPLRLSTSTLHAITQACTQFEQEHGFRPTRDQMIARILRQFVAGK